VRRARFALLAALVFAAEAAPVRPQERPPDRQGPGSVIDVRASRPPASNTFEALWMAYAKHDGRGDAEASLAALREIRRLRTERNILSLEPFALARVGQGLERLSRGERGPAEEDFRIALSLDPHLPDAHFGVALAHQDEGFLGLLPALSATASGTTARSGTILGDHRQTTLLAAAGLLALMVTAFLFGLALLLRQGVLLRHDLEERLGRNSVLTQGLFALLLVLPVVTFQGWGWLPFWWLSVLFVYLTTIERVTAVLLLLTALVAGPMAQWLELRLLASQNPLFTAGVAAIESGPDTRAVRILEEAFRQNPDDKDLVYMLAAQYKKAGRYEEAVGLYNELLKRDPADVYALNNLGNLAFAGGEFQAAIPRYQAALAANPGGRRAATLYYNLSLAQYQKFERQQADEARSQADRLDAGLTESYDALWKYEIKNENAVVDLGLTGDELWAKFSGQGEGLGVKNVAGQPLAGGSPLRLGALANRFSAALVLGAVTVFAISRWRGSRMFTMRCAKCGTPFCHHCHLGAAQGELCTQCHHLFVVRDGVSGPARNQKLLEVQREDEKRERTFRILSLIAPGSGHVYARRAVSGLFFLLVWSLVLVLCLLAGRSLPLTEASAVVTRPWGLGLAAVVLLAVYIVANRARPDFEVIMSAGRGRARDDDDEEE
jgi:Tfp pilus assembly protein PilF